MKYNKFLMAFVLSMGISANTSYCAAGAWDVASRYGAKAWNYGPGAALRYGVKHGTQALKYGGRLLSSVPRTSSYLWNKVSSWSPTTQMSVLAVLLTGIAAAYQNRETFKQGLDNIVNRIWPETSSQANPIYGGIEEVATGTGQQPTIPAGQQPVPFTLIDPVYQQPEPSQITQLSPTQIQTEPVVKQQGPNITEGQLIFENLLKERQYDTNFIAELQKKNKNNTDLNNAWQSQVRNATSNCF